MSQFGSLDTMQAELDGAGTPLPVHLLGVNMGGSEAANPAMVAGRSIPWLQDAADGHAHEHWNAQHFDLVLVDETNTVIEILDLRDHDLTDPVHYEEVKSKLRQAAQG